MRIVVITPSRGRVFGLTAVLSTLKYLESGRHQVKYCVISDDDDPETAAFCAAAKHIPITNRVGPRQTTMGGAINDMAEYASSQGAEVYTVINDDVLCLSANWDQTIAEAVEKTPHGVFWWGCDPSMTQDALYPVVTEKWRKAAGGIFTDYFPFWYDDLCLAELWLMATDSEALRLDCQIIDKPVRTTRMRELRFWQQVYTKTRVLREKQARDIAGALGLPVPECTVHVSKLMTARLKAVPDEKLDEIERTQGETSAPDDAYLMAKANAEELLRNIRRMQSSTYEVAA